jgi:hypothetical protein
VWADQDGDGNADIAVEDPLQTIVAYEPGSNYRRRVAALKVWLDDIRGTRRADVYSPRAIYKFEAPAGFQSREPTTDDKIRIPWAPEADGRGSRRTRRCRADHPSVTAAAARRRRVRDRGCDRDPERRSTGSSSCRRSPATSARTVSGGPSA